MRFLGLFARGTEDNRELQLDVESVIKELADGVLFESREQCEEVARMIQGRLPTAIPLHCEFLNTFVDPLDESVVFCVSRSANIKYGVAYLHFYKVREVNPLNVINKE